jgi:hypothetical protein
MDAPCFSYMMMNMYEKYNDMLIGSLLLFVHDIACVKSIRSSEVCRSEAPCFLCVVLHM